MNGHNLLSKKGRTLVSAYKERNSHEKHWAKFQKYSFFSFSKSNDNFDSPFQILNPFWSGVLAGSLDRAVGGEGREF